MVNFVLLGRFIPYWEIAFFLFSFLEKQKKFFSNEKKTVKTVTNGVLKYERSECFKLAMSNGF